MVTGTEQSALKPPLQWPREGVVRVRFNEEIQDVWAKRYGNLTEIFKEGVARFGDKEMWYFPDFNIRWTFNEFNKMVNRVAYALSKDYGVGKGDRIAIMMNNVPEAFVAYLALSQIGAISIIINARLAAEEVERQLKDAACMAIMIEGALWENVKQIPHLVPELRHVFVTHIDPGSAAKPFGILMEKEAPREIIADVTEKDICSLIYTSGTTGRPKGTITLHRALVNNAMNGLNSGAKVYDTNIENWRQLILTPFFHVTTLHTLVNYTLSGASSVVITTFDANKAINCLIDEQVNSSIMVTAMYWILSLHPRYPELVKANRLNYILQGGSPMPPEMCTRLAQDFPNARVGNGYGFTEGASIGWLLLMAGDWETILKKPGSVGGTLGNSNLRLVDDKLKDVPRGQPGEIVASSPGISPGYWNLPEETAASFFKDANDMRWFRTGDVGYTDNDGYTFIVDRIKDMICRGGENVYSVELENLLCQNPKIMEAGVVGVPDPVLGEKIKAVVWVMPGETLTEQEVKDFCKGRIADYKVPDFVVLSPNMLPKNPGGKILKPALKQM